MLISPQKFVVSLPIKKLLKEDSNLNEAIAILSNFSRSLTPSHSLGKKFN